MAKVTIFHPETGHSALVDEHAVDVHALTGWVLLEGVDELVGHEDERPDLELLHTLSSLTDEEAEDLADLQLLNDDELQELAALDDTGRRSLVEVTEPAPPFTTDPTAPDGDADDTESQED